ncbi:amidohydrolase family protein [Komagataeibacter oboediens]|uniref:Hydroxydechloroatrazine ethylaminohydrolase n=1 Tax=Komagataeibacter xylinus NBRC 13693 TaxID=1234668 RepID=A0A0D6Q661_KOMXY|nr:MULTISPECIES: amidohydrolase family protein [Komagataeibacter]WEQ51476.1 amidohydrolase family protein [Komagataeibacter oboediens]GAN99047.1 hydroxydechloroatrazine ethylaminohydrolase [Komagataeibacter xylinus NBRC 13693]GCE78728.1 amidohydrolase [Komagataeibacter oboediens]
MIDILICDAHLYLDQDWEIPGGWIAIEKNRIHSVGGPQQSPPQAARVINAGGRLVTPGLVNAHHHMYQNLTRSYAPATRLRLFAWLQALYPLWAGLDADSVYVSTYIAMIELLLGGCTTSMDHMYIHPRPRLIDEQFRAARDIGMRFYATRGSMTRAQADGGLPPSDLVQDEDTILSDCERLVSAFHDPAPGAMGRVALGPVSMFSASERIMRESLTMAERLDLRLHTHLGEDMEEDDFCLSMYNCTPTEQFERMGWASPRTWVAHYIYPSPSEVTRMAKAGISVVQCPSSNMMIGGGSADALDMRERGIKVGLGCNGSATTDHASMWMETRNAMLLGRVSHGPAAMGAREALDMATRGGAACLGWDDEIGHLRPGACADLVIWHANEVALAGAITDPVEAWLRCGPAVAGTSIVNGRVLVENCQPTMTALKDMLREHAQQARRIQKIA